LIARRNFRKLNIRSSNLQAMEANEELFEWTGMRNAPIAIFNDEPPQSILLEHRDRVYPDADARGFLWREWPGSGHVTSKQAG
jgi:hypothetical protein